MIEPTDNVYAAFQYAADNLPERWQINVCVERNAGWLELMHWENDSRFEPSPDSSMSEQIYEAVKFALEQEA